MFVIRQFLGDFFQFDTEKKLKRIILSCCWLLGTFGVNEWLHIPLLNLTANILMMLLVSCVYEGNILKKLLVCIMIAVLGAACDMLAYAVTTPFLKENEYYYSFTFTVVFLLIIERVMGVTIRREKTWNIVGKEMLALSGFPLMSVIILYCVTAMDSGIYKLVACICVVGMSLLSVNLYNGLAVNLSDSLRKEQLEREVEAYKHEMDLMRISKRKEENLRHDLRHHLFEIEGLAKQGKNQKVCDYIEDLRRTFVDSKGAIHTGEYETDSLINYLIDSAKNNQIAVECDIKIPEDIDVSHCKLNVIVGNLLENAIDAAGKSETKKVILTMHFSGGILFLQLKNTYVGNIRIENGYVQGKRNSSGHGIGLRSVQDLVKEQNGALDIKIEDDYFVVEGMIPLA